MMVSPVWMLRINPMARQRLADAELANLLEQLVELETATSARAEAAADDLYRLVPAARGERRGLLLRLRRDIHNDRPVQVPPGLPPSVVRWAEHRDRRSALRDLITGGYQRALRQERSMLRERLGEGNFLTTLAQSAPGVYDDAGRYCIHDTADSQDRKAERALVQYLTRAMVRTSPYGRFTAAGLARPDPDGVALDAVVADTASPQVEVDRSLFEYLMGGLMAGELLSLPVTARVGDGHITFFQVGTDSMRRLSAPLTGHTKRLVDLVTLGPQKRSTLDLAFGDQLIGRAVQVGLLVAAWRGDEFVAEPVREAERDLAVGGDGEMLSGLRLFQSDLDRLAAVGREDVGVGIAIRHRLAAAGEELSRRARRPVKLAVHEDFVLDPLLVDPSTHQPALDDLAVVTELLAAFDRMPVVRALLARALVDRFGAGCQVPLLAHAEDLVRTVYQAERVLAAEPDAAPGPPDGSLSMLVKVRREARAALGRDLGARTGVQEVCWLPQDVADLVAGVPDRFRSEPASYGLVVQPLGRDLIVNDAYAGHGPMVSRFLHADRVRGGDAGDRLRSRLRALHGPQTRLLEDGGCYGLSLNAHPPVLEDVVDPERWSRLRIGHDVATDTVSLIDGDGEPVTVLALGAQLPELLPHPARLATWLCSSGRVVLDIPASGRGPAGAATTAGYSRLRVGRVVLSRRRWYPGADFPASKPAGGEADHLLALARWRAAHGVPAEVVLKSVLAGPTMWESLDRAASMERFLELRRQSKPQYVDLASALMARILPRLLARRPGGFIEEALPALAEGGHAVEWMIEMARPTGGSHFGWQPSGTP